VRQVCLVSVLLWHFTPALAEEVATETNLTKEDLVKEHITKKDLAENNKLFITLATKFLRWEKPLHLVRTAEFDSAGHSISSV